MPSASDGPSSPGRGRVQAEPTGSGQTPPSRFAKNPHAPGVCEGTSRPQHHHRKAAVAKEGKTTPALPSAQADGSSGHPLSEARRFSGVQLLAGPLAGATKRRTTD